MGWDWEGRGGVEVEEARMGERGEGGAHGRERWMRRAWEREVKEARMGERGEGGAHGKERRKKGVCRVPIGSQ